MVPQGSADDVRAGTPVQLVVLNGRQRGARKPLDGPATLVGRAEDCDVRLNVEGIEPFHCVIARGTGEATIRDLDSNLGTFVNGQRVRSAKLRDGDLLDIGPFRFRVLLPVVKPVANSGAAQDGIRIQIAAVVAQQVAVDEREIQNEDRQAALEERQRQLAAAAEQLEADKRRWELDQAEVQGQVDEREADLNRERQGVWADCNRLAGEQARLDKRAAGLDRLQADLQSREAALALRQVHFNTERELDSRVLEDGMQRLTEDQKRHRSRRNRERAALEVRRIQLIEGERKLAETRTSLVAEKQAWEAQQRLLETELFGLHARIAHERQKLHEAPPAMSQVAVDIAAPISGPSGRLYSERVVDLDELAGKLADQRQQIVEQWDRLAAAQLAWQAQRDEAAAGLETLAQRLADQEQSLDRREKGAQATETRLQQWREQLDQVRRETALAQARMEAERQTEGAERDRALGDARRLGELARRQLDALSVVREKWNRKRRLEAERLRTEKRAAAQLRQDLAYARLMLAREDQAQGLQEDMEELEDLLRELAQKSDRLAHVQTELAERESSLDEREAFIAAYLARLEQSHQEAEGRYQYAERRLAVLQDESEHLARALLPDDEPATPSLERAA